MTITTTTILKKTFNYLSILLIASTTWSCKKEHAGPSKTPSVNSLAATSVTSTTATSGGVVVDDGGNSVSSRGICYSTTVNPTLLNNVVPNGEGIGKFTCELTGLMPNTTYYLRAYATNNIGTSYGTNEIIFNTLAIQPSASTYVPTSVTSNQAIVGAEIKNAGNLSILSQGICYGITPHPTTTDSVQLSISGLPSFSVTLTGLTANTTYFARSFATTGNSILYGNEISFTTLAQVIALGEYYNGGIIFYIDETDLHGLIAASTDQSTSADWGCSGIVINGADGVAVGDGLQNTLDIVAACNTAGNAATICYNLRLGGYNDWVLPSKLELDLMNKNLYLSGIGNFSIYSYWSSTEADAGNATSFNFKNNVYNTSNKNSPYVVRAIRGF